MKRLTVAQKALVASQEAQQLVHYAVRLLAFMSPGANSDDFTSVANEALVHAALRYDASRGVRFATFASKSVMGRLHDFLHTERRFQRWRTAIGPSAPLVQPTAESAHDSEDQATARVRRRLEAAFAARAMRGLSAARPTPSPEQIVSLTQQWRSAMEALARGRAQLSADQALLIQRHFYDGISVERIATELGCSRSTAYRLRKEGLERLCTVLTAAGVTSIEATA